MIRHGHVIPRPDGNRTRCGGPHLCATCARERQQLFAVSVALHEPCVEQWARAAQLDPGRMQTLHGADAHFPIARKVLLALDDVDDEGRHAR